MSERPVSVSRATDGLTCQSGVPVFGGDVLSSVCKAEILLRIWPRPMVLAWRLQCAACLLLAESHPLEYLNLPRSSAPLPHHLLTVEETRGCTSA